MKIIVQEAQYIIIIKFVIINALSYFSNSIEIHVLYLFIYKFIYHPRYYIHPILQYFYKIS